MPARLLPWSLAVAAGLHIFEEFVWPGDFKAWWIAYRPQTAGRVSDRFLLGINALLMVMTVAVAIAVQIPRGNGVAAWLTLAALLFSNAIFHLVGAAQTRCYSPGMTTGLLLYMPIAVIGYIHFLRVGRATAGTAIIAALLGSSYHFIAFANHRRRSQRANAA